MYFSLHYQISKFDANVNYQFFFLMQMFSLKFLPWCCMQEKMKSYANDIKLAVMPQDRIAHLKEIDVTFQLLELKTTDCMNWGCKYPKMCFLRKMICASYGFLLRNKVADWSFIYSEANPKLYYLRYLLSLDHLFTTRHIQSSTIWVIFVSWSFIYNEAYPKLMRTLCLKWTPCDMLVGPTHV